MADTVTTQTYDGAHNFVITMNSLSDGTGETLVKKVDVTTMNPNPTTHLVLWRCSYNIQAGSVELYWEGSPNKILLSLSGSMTDREFRRWGGLRDDALTPTGNVLLSTIGFAANSGYSITLEFKKGGITGFSSQN
jgi:hypothetical protein